MPTPLGDLRFTWPFYAAFVLACLWPASARTLLRGPEAEPEAK